MISVFQKGGLETWKVTSLSQDHTGRMWGSRNFKSSLSNRPHCLPRGSFPLESGGQKERGELWRLINYKRKWSQLPSPSQDPEETHPSHFSVLSFSICQLNRAFELIFSPCLRSMLSKASAIFPSSTSSSSSSQVLEPNAVHYHPWNISKTSTAGRGHCLVREVH